MELKQLHPTDEGKQAFYLNKVRDTAAKAFAETNPDPNAQGFWNLGFSDAEAEYETVKAACDADPRKRLAWGVQMIRKLSGMSRD